jgi:hypothetical protein
MSFLDDIRIQENTEPSIGKIKVLIGDPICTWSGNFPPRWIKGQIAEIIENTFEKYDYCVLFNRGMLSQRVIYFYKDEIKEI